MLNFIYKCMLYPVVARNSGYWVRIPAGSDVGHRWFTYTMLQSIAKQSLECAMLYISALCTIKNPRSHSIRVMHSPDIGLLLSRYYHDCAECDVKQYSLSQFHGSRATLSLAAILFAWMRPYNLLMHSEQSSPQLIWLSI